MMGGKGLDTMLRLHTSAKAPAAALEKLLLGMLRQSVFGSARKIDDVIMAFALISF